MLDVPVESAYVWIGLTVVSAAMVGLAVRVPTAPPPDATAVARTVDSVASSPYEATARQPVEATEIRVGSERVSLRSSGGEAGAAFAYDSVVPAFGRGPLRAVLYGRPPEAVFDSEADFAAAVADARTTDPAWRPAPERVLVRRVEWGGVNATLVGA